MLKNITDDNIIDINNLKENMFNDCLNKESLTHCDILQKLIKKYEITIINDSCIDTSLENNNLYKEISINGFTSIHYNYLINNNIYGNVEDLNIFDKIGYRIINISFNAFNRSKVKGCFKPLKYLKYIQMGAFSYTELSGCFENFPSLECIDESAFYNCNFTGDFKNFPSLKIIKKNAFLNNNFNGIITNIPNLETIEEKAFYTTDRYYKYRNVFNYLSLNDNVAYEKNCLQVNICKYKNYKFLENIISINNNDLDPYIVCKIKNSKYKKIYISNNHINIKKDKKSYFSTNIIILQ